jgi:hypothetical protein
LSEGKPGSLFPVFIDPYRGSDIPNRFLRVHALLFFLRKRFFFDRQPPFSLAIHFYAAFVLSIPLGRPFILS